MNIFLHVEPTDQNTIPEKLEEGTIEKLIAYTSPKASRILFKDSDLDMQNLNDMCFEAMKIEVIDL
jgi:hypothetical protein